MASSARSRNQPRVSQKASWSRFMAAALGCEAADSLVPLKSCQTAYGLRRIKPVGCRLTGHLCVVTMAPERTSQGRQAMSRVPTYRRSSLGERTGILWLSLFMLLATGYCAAPLGAEQP